MSWNTAALLDRCLASLPAALAGTEAEGGQHEGGRHEGGRHGGGQHEIVVVDNASSDGSADVAARHPGVRVVRNATNAGYATAMNQALAGGEAEVLIALNPDAEPPPGSLATLVERLVADPGVALVAPTLVGADGRAQWTARRFPSLGVGAATCLVPGRWQAGRLGRRLNLELADQPSRPADVDWAIGAVHVIRADALAGRAPYDERWFMYVEDLELCWWLARRGWRRRFEADVTIPHVGNAAGDQAWGEDYMGRCFDAMYDWYERDRSRAGVRAWAALNALRVLSRAGFGVLARRPEEHVAALRRELPHHTRVVLRGAPPPAGPAAPAAR